MPDVARNNRTNSATNEIMSLTRWALRVDRANATRTAFLPRGGTRAEGSPSGLKVPLRVEASDETMVEADQKVGGGPSVLDDAVAVLLSEDGANSLLKSGAARDFISDAFVHVKFIACVSAALPLFERAGIGKAAKRWTRDVSNSPAPRARQSCSNLPQGPHVGEGTVCNA